MSEDLQCPACQDVLQQVPLYSTFVAGCRSCGGMWFDEAAADLVAKARLHPSFLLVVDGFDATDEGKRPTRDRSYRDGAQERLCPMCGERLGLDERTGVRLDVCAAHGSFFDRHEVRALHRQLMRRPQLMPREEKRVIIQAAPSVAKSTPQSGASPLDVLEAIGNIFTLFS